MTEVNWRIMRNIWPIPEDFMVARHHYIPLPVSSKRLFGNLALLYFIGSSIDIAALKLDRQGSRGTNDQSRKDSREIGKKSLGKVQMFSFHHPSRGVTTPIFAIFFKWNFKPRFDLSWKKLLDLHSSIRSVVTVLNFTLVPVYWRVYSWAGRRSVKSLV